MSTDTLANDQAKVTLAAATSFSDQAAKPDADGANDVGHPAPMSAETAKARKKGNIVIALSIVAFVVLIFVTTLVRLGGNIAERM